MDNEKQSCKICNTVFDNDLSLHKHFRKHGVTIVDYYTTYYPRFDKLTKESIEFKNKNQYFNTDFNSKDNLASWIKFAGQQEVKDYITNFLTKRKTEKKLKFAPCQVELRTLMCPAILTIERFLGNYKDYVESLGFEYRFYDNPCGFLYAGLDNTILIDTREQQPLELENIKTRIETLNYGDYRLEKSLRSPACVIERKSPSDFVCTFSSHLDRFKNELERCKNDNAYMVVLVEEGLSNLLDFKNKSKAFSKTKITPEFLFRNVRDLLQNEDKIQFLFVKDRGESARVTKKILNSQYWHVSDLQYYYDKKEL